MAPLSKSVLGTKSILDTKSISCSWKTGKRNSWERHSTCLQAQGDGNPPSFPSSFSSYSDATENAHGGQAKETSQQQAQQDISTDTTSNTTNKANRFSKFAPSAGLSTEDFREQLRENMKADLEKRRKNDPNRGNQPAKSYLDSL